MKNAVELLFPGSLALATPALGAPINRVTNGDFELGNTGFSSSYIYVPSSNTAEAHYTVRTSPSFWNPFFISAGDHTSGTGNMFVGNGSPTAGSLVWGASATISVLPNTDCFFEAWAMNVCCTPNYTGLNSPAIPEFAVVGDQSTVSLGTNPHNPQPGHLVVSRHDLERGHEYQRELAHHQPEHGGGRQRFRPGRHSLFDRAFSFGP